MARGKRDAPAAEPAAIVVEEAAIRWAPARLVAPGEAVVLARPKEDAAPGWTHRRAVRMVGRRLAVVLRLEPGQPSPTTGQRVRYEGGPWPLRASLVEVLS
jgi:hypothetical protein